MSQTKKVFGYAERAQKVFLWEEIEEALVYLNVDDEFAPQFKEVLEKIWAKEILIGQRKGE